MAHVFQSPSENKEKLETAYRDYVEKARKDHERFRKSGFLLKVLLLGILVASIAACVLMIFSAPFRNWLLQKIAGMFKGLGDALFGLFGEGDVWVLKLLSVVVSLLSGVPYIIGSFFATLPFLATVLLLAVFAVLAFFAWIFYDTLFGPFNEEYARTQAEAQFDEKMHRIKAGVEGEERALASVAQLLDDQSYLFANLVIKHGGGENETDFIVLSPSLGGLLIVEAKNYSGHLYGDWCDEKLMKKKINKRGVCVEEKEDDNPVRQVEAPVRRLNSYLKGKGISVPIKSCALFVNPKAEFHLTDRLGLLRNCPVFQLDSSGFANYLHSSFGSPLPAATVARLVEALKEQM